MALGSGISTLAGVGGTVAFLCVNLVFFDLDPHRASAQAILFAVLSTLTRLYFELSENIRKKINYDVVLLSATPTILGSFFGVYLNELFPSVILLVFSIGLLGVMIYHSMEMYREKKIGEGIDQGGVDNGGGVEHHERKRLVQPTEMKEIKRVEERDEKVEHKLEKSKTEDVGRSPASKNDEKKGEDDLDSPLVDNEDPTPMSALHDQYALDSNDKIFYVLLMILNPIFSYLRGTRNRQALVDLRRCGKREFTLITGYIVFLGYIAVHLKKLVFERNYFTKQNILNVNFNDKGVKQMIVWMFFVGLFGSMLSLGIGALLTYSLVSVGMTPFTAVPTSLMIGVLYGTSASIVYFAEGYIVEKIALVGALVVIASTYLTRVTIYDSLLKRGHGSAVLMFLAGILALGICVILYEHIPKLWHDYSIGKDLLEFNSIC